LFNAQERCTLFVGVGVPVYAGMVVGENSREDDISVNVCKTKHLTNCRASGSDEALKLTPPTTLSLEQCLEFITDDEYVEVTPPIHPFAQGYPRPLRAHAHLGKRKQEVELLQDCTLPIDKTHHNAIYKNDVFQREHVVF